MIRTDILRGKIAELGLSQRAVAKELGMAEKTFYNKMRKGVFDSNEILALINLLHLSDPLMIFFSQDVA